MESGLVSERISMFHLVDIFPALKTAHEVEAAKHIAFLKDITLSKVTL